MDPDALFTLAGAVRRDPAVEGWFSDRAPELGAIALEWFDRMRACGDDVTELIHDGCPVACVDEAAFAYVNVFKAHVNVGFFHGSSLDDPAWLLEGSGRRMRHVKLKPGEPVDREALGALIGQAYLDIRLRMAGQRRKPEGGGTKG